MQTENAPNDAKSKFILALSKAQSEMKPATKDANNPHFKSKYADYNSVVNSLREPLSKYEFSYSHENRCVDSKIIVITTLSHSGGYEKVSEMSLEIKSDGRMNPLQAMGSAISYMKRYNLCGLTGLSTDDDDDGNLSSKQSSTPAVPVITPIQAQTLKLMLEKCPKDFHNMIMKEIANYKIVSIDQLPSNHYEPLLKSLKNKLESLNESKSA